MIDRVIFGFAVTGALTNAWSFVSVGGTIFAIGAAMGLCGALIIAPKIWRGA